MVSETVVVMPPVYVQMSVAEHAQCTTFSLFLFHARLQIEQGTVSVYYGFMQLFLSQTWVKCTLLD